VEEQYSYHMSYRPSPESASSQDSLSWSKERVDDGMDVIETVVSILDITLDTKRKRHIVGGILLSVSLLFGGLALTTMTMNMGEE